jgi:preprotein translocase subunit SecA
MQCWKLGQKAQSADDWRQAVEIGREAVAAFPEAPEPRFNLSVALMGLAKSTDDQAIREEAVAAFDEARGKVDPHVLPQYATTAIALLEKRTGQFGADPAYQYALGSHLAVLGKNARARRALEAAGPLGEKLLAEVPEPVIAKSAPVGRNDPCPCGSGKKYKKCHGA